MLRHFSNSNFSTRFLQRFSVRSRTGKSLVLALAVLTCFALTQWMSLQSVLASITGDSVNVQFANGPVKAVTVGAGVEIPNAGPVLGAAGNAPRWNIDLDSATIRVDFIDQIASYGNGAFFLFSDLNPKINACAATVTGITVMTNKPVGQINVAALATFTASSVRIQIAPNSGVVDWSPGEFVEVRLSYQPVQGCNPCAPPPAGMKLWHPYDETSGTVANDIAGFNNIGVYGPAPTRPTQVAGVVGGALQFDGVDDYLEVANATDIDVLGNCVLDGGEHFTVDMWIKTSSQAGLQTILDKRTHPGNTLEPRGYSLFLSNGRVGFQMGNGGGAFTNFVAPTAPVNDGNPHFIAVTFTRCRPAGGSIYVDGVLVHSFTPLIGNLSNSANLIIGNRQPAFGANPFNGIIDELEIFKRALSAAELNAIFAAGSGGKCKNNCEPKACDVASFDPPTYYTAGANPNFITFGNFNTTGGDLADDLVAVNRNAGTVSIFRGFVNGLLVGDGNFNPTPVATLNVGANPSSAVAADFNKDGFLDLVVALAGGGNNVVSLLGNGDFTFQAPQTFSAGGQPLSIIALDYDNDTLPDLAVANLSGVRLMKGGGNGTFAPGATLGTLSQPSYVAAADLNNDGQLDLAVSHIGAGSVSILLANGSGGFNPKVDYVAGGGSFGLTIGDFNQDGSKDIATANSFASASGAVSVLLNNGNGTFGTKTDFPAGTSPLGVANGDLNGDGKLDLITTDGSNARIMILPGDGAGNFGAAQPVNLKGTSSQIVVADFNKDGKLDLAATVPAANQPAILLNNCLASVPIITVTPTSLSNGTVGQSFTQNFSASGGMGPYTFTQISGTLPTSVTLQTNGTFTGTPEQSGTFTFTVKATDKNGCMGTVTIVWRVFCPTITLSPATVHAGTAGVNYLPIEQLTVSGGTPVYSFAVTGGLLPTGMTLTNDGKLQGTPMQSGSFTFTVTVTDKFGCTGLREYTLTINCQPITIGPDNAQLPEAMQEANYNPTSQPTFTATGGCGQNAFSITSGMLPAGMTLTATGALTGTPTQNGDFEFTVKVTDKCGCMATKVYKLKVSCPQRSLLNTKLFNTGVSSTANPLPTPTPDPHYGVTYGTTSQTPLAVKEFPGWMPNTSASQWISPYADYAGTDSTVYTYRTFFSLDKCDPASARIEGRWAADNKGEIWFNGAKVAGADITVNTGFQQWQSFTISSNFGTSNTIEFRVTNESGPTGLRVEFIRAFAKCCDCVQPPPPNMVAWWPLDEPKGAVVVNDLAGANPGSPKPGGAVGSSAPVAITGKVAGAFRFTASRFVNVPHKPGLNFSNGGFSIDAWVRNSASASTKNFIVDKLDTTGKRGYRLSVQGNMLILELGDSGSIQTYPATVSSGFSVWQFVAATVDRPAGGAGTVRLYAGNGTVLPPPIGTFTLPASFANIDTVNDVRIGFAAAGTEAFDVDEVELFNRKLEPAELEGILKAGPAGKCKPCVMPKITLHPVSQTVCPNSNAILMAAASGSPVPTVQWQVMVGTGPWTDIPGATSTTLVVTAGALKHGNKYRAIFVNACCDAITNAATVNIVQPPLFCVNDTTGGGGGFGKNGGSGSMSIVVAAGTPINVTSTASWLTIDSVETSAASSLASSPGQTEQSATIYYTAAANDGAGGRVGGLKIGAQNVTVVQAGANPVTTVSAARFSTLSTVSADSIVAAFGLALAGSTQVATTVPLPTTLAGTQVKVLDAAGTERGAPLFFVSPNQVNYLVPPASVTGPALVTVTAGDGTVSTGTLQITRVAPGLFTADASGRGVPAANALLFRPDGSSTSLQVGRFDSAQGKFVSVPLDFGAANNRLFLVLFGTGILGRTDLAGVSAQVGGISAQVAYAGPQGSFVGLDQLNIEIPQSLIGRGEVDVEVIVDGQVVNIVTINIK